MTRSVLIGLDGGTFTILDRLMDDGTMPHLAAVARAGVRAELLSTPNPVTPPAWTSVMTGRSPGYHGILDFVRAEERQGGMYFTITNSRDVRCETIWSLASRQGRRVTVLNFYGTAPPRPVAGYLVPGFVPGRHLRRACFPRDLSARVSGVPGLDFKALGMDLDEAKKCVMEISPEAYEEWVTLHIRRERQWFRLLRHLMEVDPCDLTAIVFDGVDKLQHLCWRFLVPDGLEGEFLPWERKVRQLCIDYFRQLDWFVAEVVEQVGRDGRVFIVSDHGFGPTTEVVYINTWLERQGYLTWSPGATVDRTAGIMVDRLKNHVTLLDWKATTAYALTPSSNGIFLRGVEGNEYYRAREELVDGLARFMDESSGERVVTGIRTREEAFPGPWGRLAPDLTLTLRDGGLVSILRSDAPLKRRAEVTGTHRPEGIFIAVGAGIRRDVTLGQLSILDVAPTLLYSMGLAIPEDFEGRVPEEIFEAAFIRAAPPRAGEGTRPVGAFAGDDEEGTLDSEGEAVILDRLRGLGYLE